MQDDLSKLQETYKIYLAAALPLAALSLGLALVLTLPSVQRFGRRLRNGLMTPGDKKDR
jgi:hypothetical protein